MSTELQQRKDYLLKVAIKYIRAGSLGHLVNYDDAECDGYCLIDDINAVLEQEEED